MIPRLVDPDFRDGHPETWRADATVGWWSSDEFTRLVVATGVAAGTGQQLRAGDRRRVSGAGASELVDDSAVHDMTACINDDGNELARQPSGAGPSPMASPG